MKTKPNPRTLLAFTHDIVAAALAWCLAYWLRFNLDIPEIYWDSMWRSLVWVMPAQALIFRAFGLYRGIWRYASLPDLRRILLAIAAATVVTPLILYMLRMEDTPRSVLLLDPLLLAFMMGGSRLAYRAWKEHRLYGLLQQRGQPVLVLGAGDTAANLVRELSHSKTWHVVGLLDDDPEKQGRLLHGIKVHGPLDDLAKWSKATGATHAIIAMPGVHPTVRRRAAELCNAARVDVLTVPAFEDLVNGRVTVSEIRKVEVDDLLGRDKVILDNHGLQDLIGGNTIMVSGAGGSIGSELCRQIARFEPRLMVLFELNEFALYRIEQECRERFPDIPLICAIGDVKNASRVNELMRRHAPVMVFHAAAYKHVPLMENENAWEAVRNNILGTYTLARAAQEHGVKKLVMISTDKAVNPTNVMGASKRLAEMVCQGLQHEGGTAFIIVRFGNVLGSTGSVIPKFHEQIAKGGPITVTHPDIIRYFMSIPEATQLVLQAGLMGHGGEIFVLDMGEPVKIADLARDMIRLSGFTEDDIRIVYTGLRPGEKLFEELLADGENTLPTPHPKLRIAKARSVDQQWLGRFLTWLKQEPPPDELDLKQDLSEWVPEYKWQRQPGIIPRRRGGA
ncbi:MAG: polysaccharide biosynthesis protein [Sulfuricella sp.]|nr:polysaccharide biosynthesis protein [Sulfuricella sp.]